MARRTVRSFRPASRPRRKLIWGRRVHGIPLSAAPGVTTEIRPLDSLEAEIGAQLLGSTIMRIHASLLIWANPVTAVETDFANVAWGFVVREAPANLTLNPSSTDIHSDWMHWGARTLRYQSEDPLEAEAGLIRVEMDVKSRRKLDEVGQRLEFHLSNAVGSNTDVLYTLHTSVLVALS